MDCPAYVTRIRRRAKPRISSTLILCSQVTLKESPSPAGLSGKQVMTIVRSLEDQSRDRQPSQGRAVIALGEPSSAGGGTRPGERAGRRPHLLAADGRHASRWTGGAGAGEPRAITARPRL